MKTLLRSTAFCGGFFLLITITGCREITTTTRIFPNGSCERTIVVSGDSAAVDSMFSGPFPMPVDSTWRITHKTDSTWKTVDAAGGGKKQERKDNKRNIAQKSFKNVAGLNRLYKAENKDSLKVRAEISLDRKFRWFNTFFRCQETIKPAVPFKNVPIGEFMTPGELSLYYIKEDTLHLDKKVDQWVLKGVFEDIFKALLRASETIPDKRLGPGVVRESKDGLFAAFNRADHDNMDDGAKLTLFLAKFYKTNAVTRWRGQMDEVMKLMEKKQEFFLSLDTDSYAAEIIMPGLILDTNASTVEGNKAVWKFKGNRLFWENYVMLVESRVVNTWAIWVTGAAVLAALAGLVIFTVKRK